MKIIVEQKIDNSYYQEFYTEWLQYRTTYRKWEHKTGFMSLALAVFVYFMAESSLYFSVGLLGYGALMIYDFYLTKHKWLKERLSGKMNEKNFTMIFEENQIQSIGPFTTVTAKWEFFIQAIESKKGLFLIPENGISIYLQKQSFEHPAEIQQIIRKFNKK